MTAAGTTRRGITRRGTLPRVLLYGTLAVCVVAVALLVYRYDLYDREPLLLLAVAGALGFGAMVLAGRVQVMWLTRLGDGAVENRWIVAALAGSHEELAKVLAVLLIALAARRFFNDPMDGLIYGSIVGLGCAVEESIDVLSEAAPGGGLPPQEVIRQLGHAVMGGIGSFGLGLLRGRTGAIRHPRSIAVAAFAIGGSFLLAVLLHFAWDVIAVPANETGVMTLRQRSIAVALMMLGLAVYGLMVKVGSGWSRRAFPGPRPRGAWGWPVTGRR